MKKALLIANKKASQAAECLEEITDHLTQAGLQVEHGQANSATGYEHCLAEREGDIDLLVVAGGDGTVRCGAEAILKLGTGLPLGIVPLGTANNVARSLGLPLDLAQACRVIGEGRTASMDLARVNGRIFVSVAGIGLSTKVHEEVPAEQKKRWGALSYAAQAFKLLLRQPPTFHAVIRSDEETVRVKALQVTVCNGRYYGAHVAIHPEASLHDGFLDASIVEGHAFLRGMFKALLPLPSGHASPGLRLLRSRKFELTTRPVMKIDVEGETDLRTPATFEVLPGALSVFVPEPA